MQYDDILNDIRKSNVINETFNFAEQMYFIYVVQKTKLHMQYYKKKMLEAKKLYNKTKESKLKNEIYRCNNIHWAKKIELNINHFFPSKLYHFDSLISMNK